MGWLLFVKFYSFEIYGTDLFCDIDSIGPVGSKKYGQRKTLM